jgi:hypothetical protein
MRREAPLRIFLSHTSELREHPRERSYVAAAEAAVMRAGHAISNMAYFAARDTGPAEYCTAEVERADVFVGVIGMRCGSTVRDRPDVSYTELEFEAATAAGIPRLILLVKEDAAGLPAVEQLADHASRQAAFRRRLQEAGVTTAGVSAPAETELGLYAALTVTVELPIVWSGSRQYNVVTLQVAACGECARDLQEHGNTLLAARVQYGRLREKTEDMERLRRQLQALVEAIGPPYEPVHGGVFGRWLAVLDRNAAQAAWRLLADVKRKTVGIRTRSSDPLTPSLPVDRGRGEPPADPPLRLDGARHRRRVLVPPMEEPPTTPAPPTDRPPRGGDDAA